MKAQFLVFAYERVAETPSGSICPFCEPAATNPNRYACLRHAEALLLQRAEWAVAAPTLPADTESVEALLWNP